jgi:protein-S-isoprenylcysteine O-methyltransferase Ste14
MDKLVVILFAFAWGGVEIYSQMQQRRRRGGAPSPADRGSLIALYACITVGYGVAFAVSYIPYGRLPMGQPFWLVVGAAFVAGGLWIRHSAMVTLAAHFTYQVDIHADHRLVQEGLYRRIRHPGYLGQLLVFLGIGLALANWLSIVGLLVPVMVGFAWRIHVEEAALRARFGEEFDDYCRRTRRLIPWLY